jgi:hypothetical protein
LAIAEATGGTHCIYDATKQIIVAQKNANEVPLVASVSCLVFMCIMKSPIDIASYCAIIMEVHEVKKFQVAKYIAGTGHFVLDYSDCGLDSISAS